MLFRSALSGCAVGPNFQPAPAPPVNGYLPGKLASPAADELRACQAPRCVRYFRKNRGQEWCKPSCANRARVARYAERHQATAEG